jgi:hypothetical protein
VGPLPNCRCGFRLDCFKPACALQHNSYEQQQLGLLWWWRACWRVARVPVCVAAVCCMTGMMGTGRSVLTLWIVMDCSVC